MPRSSLSSYLRTERLRCGLSQQDFGELLGISGNAISKAENGRAASLQLVLAAEIIFEQPSRNLFPGIYDVLEYNILLRAAAMEARLAERADPVSRRKCSHLNALINRIQFKQFPL